MLLRDAVPGAMADSALIDSGRHDKEALAAATITVQRKHGGVAWLMLFRAFARSQIRIYWNDRTLIETYFAAGVFSLFGAFRSTLFAALTASGLVVKTIIGRWLERPPALKACTCRCKGLEIRRVKIGL
jgi:hypothetical protein